MQGKDPKEESMEEPKLSYPCPKCDKIFLSKNSLYDHMRYHPKRTHSDIHLRSPAATEEKSSSSLTNLFPGEPTNSIITSANAVNKRSSSPTNSFSSEPTDSFITPERSVVIPESTSAFPRWEVTASRSRKSSCRDPTGRPLGVSRTTANDNVEGFPTLTKANRYVEGGEDDDDDTEDYYDGDGYDYEDVYRKNLNKLGELKEKEKCNDQAMNVAREGKDIKKGKLKDAVQDTDSRQYKCGICGKAFSSFQGLGGHKKSHRIKVSSSSQAVHGKMEEDSCSKGYACKTSGGHQRLHFDGDLNVVPASSAEQEEEAVTGGQEKAASSAKPEEEAVTGGRRVLDFDINELPPSEEEEEGANEER